MELAGNNASELFSIWGVHSSNLSNEEVRKIQGEWLPKVSAFFNELTRQSGRRWSGRATTTAC